MKFLPILLTFVYAATIDRKSASGFLSRMRRMSNHKGFEEFSEGNMERECIEEQCSPEELTESLDRYAPEVRDMYTDIYQACNEIVNVLKAVLPTGFEWHEQDVARQCVHSNCAQDYLTGLYACSTEYEDVEQCFDTFSNSWEDLIHHKNCTCKFHMHSNYFTVFHAQANCTKLFGSHFWRVNNFLRVSNFQILGGRLTIRVSRFLILWREF